MNKKLDFLDQVVSLLAHHGYEVLYRVIPGREPFIAVRHNQTTILNTYMTGEKEVNYQFNIYIKEENESDAASKAEDIEQILDKSYLPSSNGSYEFTKCEVDNPAHLFGIDYGFSVYLVTFQAKLLIRS